MTTQMNDYSILLHPTDLFRPEKTVPMKIVTFHTISVASLQQIGVRKVFRAQWIFPNPGSGRHCVNHIPFQQQWKWWIRTFLITMTFPKALTLERIARPVPQRQKSKNTQSNDLAHRTFMKSNSKDFWQSRRQLSPQLTLNQMKVINHIALSKHLSIRVECWKTFALRRFVTIRLASN